MAVNLLARASNPELGAAIAEFIDDMAASPSQNVLSRIAREKFGEHFGVFSFVADTPDWPRMCAFLVDNVGVIIFGGTRGLRMTLRFLNGFNPPSFGSLPPPVNTYTIESRVAFDVDTVFRIAYRQPNVIFAGHSQGAAIATGLATVRQFEISGGLKRLITFGSPKAGTSIAERLNTWDQCRWLNAGDPVALVPPWPSQSPWLYLTLPQTVRVGYENTNTLGFASVVDANGGVSISQFAPGTNVDQTTSIATWLLNLALLQTHPHNSLQYAIRMRAVVDQNPAFPAPSEQRAMMASSTRSRALAAADELSTREEKMLTEQVNSSATSQKQSPINIPSGLRFHSSRRDNVWVVTWGDDVVAVGPRKKPCQRMARLGNAFLRAFLEMGFATDTALRDLLDNWLDAATDPASGLTPQLKTTPFTV
jgi:pimeloyl-ACP methyl ester carboxylesterase